MSRYAGVIRDADGLMRRLRTGIGAERPRVTAGRRRPAPARSAVAGRPRNAPSFGCLELEAVEAANLRTVSLLIAAGAARRAESRGCHRRRDAAGTGAAPWHTLLRWDGQQLVVTEEEL